MLRCVMSCNEMLYHIPIFILHSLIKALFNVELHKAACGYDGAGMENGIDMDAKLALVRCSKSIDDPFKCTIESMLSATMWPTLRIHNVAPSLSTICPRCGDHPESSLHCFWTCPANASISDEAVASTQCLKEKAVTASIDCLRLWLRGIMPADKTCVKEEFLPPNDIVVRYTNKPRAYMSGKYCGDGSGGEFSS